MDSSSDHSSRASPVTGSPKHPHSPSTQQSQQQQQQQLHGSQHQPPPSHQSHGRDQIRDHQQHRGVPTPGSPTRGSPPQGLPLSPPPLSAGGGPGAPPGMVPRMPGLPPPGLGLLGQLGGMLSGHHGSPLELMAAHHAVLPPRSYNSPPPISTSDPTANECKLVDYRGQKVAAFIIAGDTMLCLPQAFELFLKHLVGGLHTVYTKLKRLDIVPLVCNVEQVRILRGLGAIQPGVNRCKLLSCKDFDILYRDCTTASCAVEGETGPSTILSAFRSIQFVGSREIGRGESPELKHPTMKHPAQILGNKIPRIFRTRTHATYTCMPKGRAIARSPFLDQAERM
ncbi:PREDICTED: splicing factor, proline- and glutamine-rich-like [Wasmannia auropunctata]|uniref:splicing factor, proline- and glutamine-rich-like n=1 Tax=Wasmannia auropunctata TaxID=64793 RepID=UPI0005EFFA3F|nr:PREDICTED: splicing factor, proline- and glutamine-rich-like [Wasmannia auropunctata]